MPRSETIYKFDAVKGSMRRLPFASILMSRENLEVANKYMEVSVG